MTSGSGSLSVRPIESDDLPRVAAFLAENFPPDSSAEDWVAAWKEINGRPGSGAPNHGMALWSATGVVGAYPAIYSTRRIRDRVERFCNLAVWCVSPGSRAASVRMLGAILAQDGYHFTDLAPTPSVQRLNLRLGFRYLESKVQILPNLPWPARSKRVLVSSAPEVISRALTGETLRHYDDHAHCRWARHVVIIRDDEPCYVQWRMEKRKNMRCFAAIQHVSHPAMFRDTLLDFSRHLATRNGALFTLVDDHVSAGRIRPAASVSRAPRKMFKSPTLGAADIDYLYSEITAAP